MSDTPVYRLAETFVAVEEGGGARPLPVTDSFWADLASRKLGDFARLLSVLPQTQDWSTWEMHPGGEEVVLLLDGDVELTLESDGKYAQVRLSEAGTYVLIPRGTWHTMTVHQAATVLFLTSGEGTQHRPR